MQNSARCHYMLPCWAILVFPSDVVCAIWPSRTSGAANGSIPLAVTAISGVADSMQNVDHGGSLGQDKWQLAWILVMMVDGKSGDLICNANVWHLQDCVHSGLTVLCYKTVIKRGGVVVLSRTKLL